MSETQKERLQKLAELRKKSLLLNKKDVIDEHKTKTTLVPVNKKRKQAEELLQKQEYELNGIDSERMDNLKYTIDDVERWDVKQKEKAEKVDRGFTDFAQIAHKKYKNMISEFKPNLNSYEQQKSNTDPQEFYRGVDSLSYADPDHKPSKEAIDRLVHDVEKQTKKRGAFSRRRAFNEDDDVTYINERNMNFNKKIERAYGKYTTEIKANFERGTAL